MEVIPFNGHKAIQLGGVSPEVYIGLKIDQKYMVGTSNLFRLQLTPPDPRIPGSRLRSTDAKYSQRAVAATRSISSCQVIAWEILDPETLRVFWIFFTGGNRMTLK
jgi:hypothetical protein